MEGDSRSMSILDHSQQNGKPPKGFEKVAKTKTSTSTNTSTGRYKIGDKAENKQASIYLDLDVIAEIDRLSKLTNKPKSHYVNELLVETFGLQKRSNGIIIEE
jgi:hypothetical protein